MGEIRVELAGSFREMISLYTEDADAATVRVFEAIEYGHAQAVAEAISWLAEEVLPAAIARDHELADQGEYPTSGGFRRVWRDSWRARRG